MIPRKTSTMPKPNGAPAMIETDQWMLGELVHANQNSPMGKAMPPIIVGGRRDSGGAKPLYLSESLE